MSNQLQFGNLPPSRCYTCKKPRWAWTGKEWRCKNCERFPTPGPGSMASQSVPESWKLGR